MVRYQRTGKLVLCGISAAMLVAACSSSSKSSSAPSSAAATAAASSAPAATAASSAAPATGASSAAPATAASSAAASVAASAAPGAAIKVMQIGTFSSAGLSLQDAKNGVVAAVAAINKAGGANGHQIDMEYCNDAFDAATGAACARQAVQDKVVAIVGAASAEAPAEIPILQAAGIPWLAGNGSGGPIEQTSPISYPLTGGTQSIEVAMGRILTTLGDKKVSVIVADAAAAYPAGDAVMQGVKLGGGTSSRTLAKIGATDFSAVASAALASKPDGIAIASVPADAPRIALALRQAGYKGDISTLAAIISDDSIKTLGANADKLYLVIDAVPTVVTSNPAVAKYTADMTANSMTSSIDSQSLTGWTAVQFFSALVTDLGSTTATPAAITSLLANLPKPISLGTVPDYAGVPSPALFAAYPRVPTFAVYVTEILGGAKVLYNGGKPFNPLS
jgi:ABC-type branched-subunit amino acid transport system substrate-binding protein